MEPIREHKCARQLLNELDLYSITYTFLAELIYRFSVQGLDLKMTNYSNYLPEKPARHAIVLHLSHLQKPPAVHHYSLPQ